LEATEDKEKEVIEDVTEIPDGLLKEPKRVDEAKSTLNEDQLKSFNGIVEFLSNPKKELVTIIGYAGTGKTYLISKIVSAVQGKVAMTAPTNKAVKVLADNRDENMRAVTYATIHKLLALKMKWVYPKGDQKFKPYQKLVSVWGKDPSVNEYDILIIDEVSMLDDELFNMLLEVKEDKLKVIFLGDAAQIPPVGKVDSIPLMREGQEEHNISVFVLDKIMRQKEGSGILKTAGSIRDNRFKTVDTISSRSTTHDVLFVKRYSQEDNEKFMDNLVNLFTSKDFDENPNFCKLIAWRNVTVDKFNQVIRRHIYKTSELKYLMPGEKLIADTPIIRNGNIVFNTSDEFAVVSYQLESFGYVRPDTNEEKEERDQLQMEGMNTVDIDKKKRVFQIPYYRTMVNYLGMEIEIDVLAPEGVEPLKWAISEVFRRKMFKEYEMLSERFAKVKYNYAITAHKSQGSTYNNVFIIEDDIDKNPTYIERNRIKYTAVSRASHNLFILSKRN
jgi:exodeoxyribonuclease-5